LTGPVKIELYIDNDSSYLKYYIENHLSRYGGYGGLFGVNRGNIDTQFISLLKVNLDHQ